RGEDAEGRVEVSKVWFATVADDLVATTHRDVERAATVDELLALANRLRADAEGIPPAVASRIVATAGDISRIGATWRSMEEGQNFTLPRDDSSAVPLPKTLAAESQRYAVWLEQIEAALNSFV